ncbi:oligosaccharide flippase family protein [Candidatus Parcubacteria bacterium]|nr:oligosaccharide flippase family protein [Patescibacteria group bacterium]MBU4467066.1 oligosaccharide flippase family protein [Patescibacteria group bacterium]MCG2688312.1 oligosaccharide flippase family protein [Candidatus Parcubacteria bacterium]
MIKKDTFLSNSFIFFLGSFVIGLGGYAFHFLMVRMLLIEEYGELQSLLAVFSIFGIPLSALAAVLMRYAADFKEQLGLGKIKALTLYFSKIAVFFAIVCFLALLFLGKSVSGFLNITSTWPLLILAAALIPSFLGVVNKGIIQGLEKFKTVSIIGIVEVITKISFAFLLVLVGFKTSGVMLAILASIAIGCLISFLPLLSLLKEEKETIQIKDIYNYFILSLFGISFLSLLFNMDVILAKHFLNNLAAGEYAGLALLGKIVFFLAGPIATVMFPVVNSPQIFKKAFWLTFLIGGLPVLGYFLFPDFIIKLLIGQSFLGISRVLGYFGLAMLSYSLINLFSQYFLALKEKGFSFFLLIGALLEIILISFWHNNISQIVFCINLVNFLVLICLAGYYIFKNKTIWLKN